MAARGGASRNAIIRGMKKIIPFCGVALSSLVVCAEGGGIVKLFPEDVKTVTIASASSIIPQAKFQAGTNMLVRSGYKVKVMPNVCVPNPVSPEVRARLFEQAWMDPETDLVLMSRGGVGAEDVVGLIDWEKLRSRDMRVIGFSDVTIIVNAMLAKGVGHPYSGKMLSGVTSMTTRARDWYCAMTAGKSVPPVKVKVLKAGEASGLPMGGHVMRMGTLSKTPFMPSAKGRVVFFECTAGKYTAAMVVDELKGLRDGGFLRGAAAVVFSDFRHTGAERNKIFAFLSEFATTLDCPVFEGFPYGHCADSRLLDFRRKVSISADGVVTWD